MKALVTGGTGLIGANLVRELVASGYGVRVMARASSDLRALDGQPVERAIGDVLDSGSLVAAADGCQILFHAATPFTYRRDASDGQTRVAVEGIRNALGACRQAGIKRMVLTSSSVVCGSSTRLQVRDETQHLDDADPPLYITAKALQEQAASELAGRLGIELILVCPTLCVGPHDYRLGPSTGAIVHYLGDPFRATFPGGANMVAAADVAAGHRLLAERGVPGERYILGSENMEWSMIHRIISELCGVPGPHMHANHTISYLTALSQELAQQWWRIPARLTREETKMVGRFYWYSHGKAAQLGYEPRPSREALAEAIGWLMTSPHIRAGVKAQLKPDPCVLGAASKHRKEGTGFQSKGKASGG